MTLVGYSKSLGILSCVSIIAQNRIIGKVCLISRLYKILWNYNFLSKLLFYSLYFLRTSIFSKQLYSFAKATFSQELICNSLFSQLQFLFITWQLALLILELLDLKMPCGFTDSWTNLSFKYQDLKFFIKTAFSGQDWTR